MEEKEPKIEETVTNNKESDLPNPEVVEEDKGIDDVIDEDFADAKVKKEKVEEKKEEEVKKPELNLRKELEEGEVAPAEVEPSKRNEKGLYEYSDDRLKAIEEARKKWNKSYKKWSTWKIIMTIGCFLLIVLAYIIPAQIWKENKQLPLYLALGFAIATVVGFLVFGFFQRKENKKIIHDYFVSYYENVNSYSFDGLDITDLTGDFDSKISEDEFKACGLYPNVASLGSRESINFKYKGVECGLADIGAQKDTGKALQTVFVGKYLRMENNLDISDQGLVIYFKGNDRAIPPDVIKTLPIIEDTKKYIVCGLKEDKKVLTPEVRQKIKEIRTDKLLVDVAISLQKGKTYFALGYEDTLMVLPNDKPFDPIYVEKYKEQIAFFLEFGLLFKKEN